MDRKLLQKPSNTKKNLPDKTVILSFDTILFQITYAKKVIFLFFCIAIQTRSNIKSKIMQLKAM